MSLYSIKLLCVPPEADLGSKNTFSCASDIVDRKKKEDNKT
jgi:hypothetical protein